MKNDPVMVKWMTERIYEEFNKFEGEKRKNFLKILKSGEKCFSEWYIIDISALAIRYCFVTGSLVIVNDIPDVRIQIFESIKELFKIEMNTIADEPANNVSDSKEKPVSNSGWFSKFNLFKLFSKNK